MWAILGDQTPYYFCTLANFAFRFAHNYQGAVSYPDVSLNYNLKQLILFDHSDAAPSLRTSTDCTRWSICEMLYCDLYNWPFETLTPAIHITRFPRHRFHSHHEGYLPSF